MKVQRKFTQPKQMYQVKSLETFSKQDHPLPLSREGRTGFSYMKEEWLRRKEMSEQKQSLYLGAVFRDN